MTESTPHIRILANADAAKVIGSALSRRRFLSFAAAASATGLLAACSPAGAAATAPQATGGALEDALSIYTWGDYDAPDVLAGFTADLGPKVTLSSFSSNEELISKLVAAKGTSGYDIVVPTGTFIPQMIENGLLSKLNLDLIPNLEHMDPAFLGRAWDPENEYSICKAWGTTGFVYDKTVITRELKDWNDFLDAAQNEASGKTSVLDDPAELTGIVLLGERHRLEHDRPRRPRRGRGLPREHARAACLGVRLVPGRRGDPAGDARAHAGVERRCAHRHDRGRRARPLAVGARRAGNRDLDGQLGDPRRCTQPRGGPRVHRLRARPRELARRARLHRLPHGRHRHRGRRRRTPQLEMLDLVFFTPEQIATMHEGAVTEAQGRIVEIWNAMKAAAGA